MTASSRAPHRWLLLVPFALGVAAFAWLVRTQANPEHAAAGERARPVRVIEAPVVAVVPRALGYGTVEPGTTWQAVAEVGGRVVEVHPRLEVGEALGAGTVLLRIDRTDYDLALARAQADILATEAQLAEIEARETNTGASLAIERQALELATSELERQRELAQRGTASRSVLDRQERDTLAQRQKVQAQVNALNLIPAQRQVLEAQLARLRALVATAERDIERTTITLPLDARIAALSVERGEVVARGQMLVGADGIAVAEVAAQVPVSRMRGLIPPEARRRLDSSDQDVRALLGLSATVRHPEAVGGAWEARFTRISPTVDPRTRTVGVIVEVDEPYRRAEPGVRPPLVKGMFVEVELSGRPRDSVVVPRTAVHGGIVYVVTDENRLARRPVAVSLMQPTFLAVADGIEAGERIVVSNLFPAIEGMLLDPIDDPESLAALEADATGIAP